MYPIVALVDCNNFYASCERVFNPRLAGKPIVVLSNNDGIIVARSNEAKAIGIQMGEPLFKIKELVKKYDVQVLSSNYTLYGDMSHRVMTALEKYSPDVEIYSIDEAFVSLEGFEREGLTSYCRRIRQTIKQWTGITVSIGIAQTKTLAKLANRRAKKDASTGGVLNLANSELVEKYLRETEVGDVWGIGPRYAKTLNANNIFNALEFTRMRDSWIRKHLTVMGLRTVTELRGIPCIKLEQLHPAKKAIVCSRSFGKPVVEKQDVMEAVSLFTARACEKMRRQRSAATLITVFLRTNPFKNTPQYHNGCMAKLPMPTDSSIEIMRYAQRAAEQIFKPGYLYNKVGVMLTGFMPFNRAQLSLFDGVDRERLNSATTAIDKINETFGSEAIFFASSGIKREWKTRRDKKTPRYTTAWDELPLVTASATQHV